MESSAFTALTEQIAEIAAHVRAVSGESKGESPDRLAHHARGGAPAERELPHPPAHAQRTAHRLCRAARQVPLPAVGNRPPACGLHRGGGRGDTDGTETQPHAAHRWQQNQRKEDVTYGTAYPKQFRELDAETDGTARPSGRTAALLATIRQNPKPDGTYQDVRQPRPLYAAPDKQAYPATLPQHRRIAVQDARQKDYYSEEDVLTFLSGHVKDFKKEDIAFYKARIHNFFHK